MRRARAWLLAAAAAFVNATSVASGTDAGTPLDGLVVRSVTRGGAAEVAGVHPGDVLLSWRGASRGRLRVPFDLTQAETESGARGRTILSGRRGEEPLAVTLPGDGWAIDAVPVFDAAAGAAVDEGAKRAAAGDAAGAEERWGAQAKSALASGRPAVAAWLWARVGEAWARTRHPSEAAAAFANASVAAGSDSLLLADVRLTEAAAGKTANDLSRAEAALDAARQIEEARPDGGLGLAAVLVEQARLARMRDDAPAADRLWTRSLALRQPLAPASLATAESLQGVASGAHFRRDYRTAERLYREALAIRERHGTDVKTGELFMNLGLVASARGDLAAAEASEEQALAIHERLAYRIGMAYDLNALGVVARKRGEQEQAEALLRRSLSVFEAEQPESAQVAGALNNLGNVLNERHEWADSEAAHRRALAIRRRISPDSLDVAASLQNLADLALERDDPDGAEPLFREALAIKARKAPGSLMEAGALAGLGRLAARRGDLDSARRLHEQALAIRVRLNPGTSLEAESRHDLATVLERAGRREEALEQWRRAVDALDLQRPRMGAADESLAAFSAQFAPLYQDFIAALADSGRGEEAFAVLERSRARGMLALLSERDIALSGPSPTLGALRDLDVEYDQVQGRLSRLSLERNASDVEAALSKQAELRQRRSALLTRLREEAPAAAALQEPRPLDLAAVRARLDPGTLLLAYAVGAQRTILFAVEDASVADGFAVFSLPLGEAALRDRVTDFRALIERGREARSDEEGMDVALSAQARQLQGDLLGPAEAKVARAQRLLICPDGPLHALPYAALRGGTPERYLIESRPMHVALSATLYVELRNRPPAPGGPPPVLALGAPPPGVAGTNDVADTVLSRAARGAPLPYAAEEVRAVGALFPASIVLTGGAATEARLKSPSTARYVHLACHSVLDSRHPLDSALVLARSPRGADNGVLQAWEVFESVHLRADLVTLSGCETGLGREMAGEGLVGLARAFHYAGAHAVLATLWAISDRSTPVLMDRFYRGLRAGKRKDDALQAAAVSLLRDPRFAHPFHWAAFVLSGDPR